MTKVSERSGGVSSNKALLQRQPPLVVSVGVLKRWFGHYRCKRLDPGHVQEVKLNGKQLEEQYGAELRALPCKALESSYRLRKALLERVPPLPVSIGSLKIWIEVYRDASAESSACAVKRHVETAAELDVEYGELIRSDEALSRLKCVELSKGMKKRNCVEVSLQVCRT